MKLSESFEVLRPRDDIVELLCAEETLLGLLPGGDTEVVARDGDHCTTETRYRALGHEGVARFRFSFLMDGSVRFEKVCDGKVWKKLEGLVCVEERTNESCEVRLELSGRTRSLVPEFTIKVPMEEQIRDMTAALVERLSGR
jgi:carbon monoxide dehydrogenase subunit G